MDLKRFSILFGWMMCVSSTMLLCMYQPFMQIWMGQENLLLFSFVICFVVYYYTTGMNRIMEMFKDAAGIWQKDRWRPLTAALVNLGLNLATVQWLGLYGVLLSSVISIVVVQIPWLFHNLFREVFPHKYLWQYVRLFCELAGIALLSCAVSWLVCSRFHLDVWLTLSVNACFSFLISNLLFFAIYGRNPLFRKSIAQIKGVLLREKTA